MKITQVTTITLENIEINALQVLEGAYKDCVSNDCYECEECPLYLGKNCIGVYAKTILSKQEGKK